MDEKSKRKNMFLAEKIARKAFCVDGKFYPIIYDIYFKIWISDKFLKFLLVKTDFLAVTILLVLKKFH